MTSPALYAWRSSRLVRPDRMLAAHPDSADSTTDPALAQEWSDALVLRLAAEFQGFAAICTTTSSPSCLTKSPRTESK